MDQVETVGLTDITKPRSANPTAPNTHAGAKSQVEADASVRASSFAPITQITGSASDQASSRSRTLDSVPDPYFGMLAVANVTPGRRLRGLAIALHRQRAKWG